jgi:hypothetical protein
MTILHFLFLFLFARGLDLEDVMVERDTHTVYKRGFASETQRLNFPGAFHFHVLGGGAWESWESVSLRRVCLLYSPERNVLISQSLGWILDYISHFRYILAFILVIGGGGLACCEPVTLMGNEPRMFFQVTG